MSKLAKRVSALKAVMPEILAAAALLASIAAVILGGLGAGLPSEAVFLDRAGQSLERKDFKEAVIWARKVLKGSPESREAGMLLVNAYAGMETLGPMVAILDQLAPYDRPVHAPAHLLRAKMILAGSGDAAQAGIAAARCLDLANQALSSSRSGGTVAIEVHALRARLAAGAGDWKVAHAAVAAMGCAGKSPAATTSQNKVLLAIAKDHRMAHPGDFRPWIQTLCWALKLEPTGLEGTHELIFGCRTWRYMPGFNESLSQRFRSDGLEGMVMLLDGLEALAEGRESEAFSCLEEGYGLLPGNPILANNYASLLACRPIGAQPGLALSIIDGVLVDYPDGSDFLDTRGRILLGLEQNQEAAASFEKALVARPSPGTHLALAEAFARLGMEDKALEHRDAARHWPSGGR